MTIKFMESIVIFFSIIGIILLALAYVILILLGTLLMRKEEKDIEKEINRYD